RRDQAVPEQFRRRPLDRNAGRRSGSPAPGHRGLGCVRPAREDRTGRLTSTFAGSRTSLKPRRHHLGPEVPGSGATWASQEIIKPASWTNQARTKAFRRPSRHPPRVPHAKEQAMPAATQNVIRPASYGANPGTADLAALKSRQQASWSSGDYAVVGTTL